MNAYEKCLETIRQYGGIDGAHHKQWVLDRLVRIMTSCPTVTRTATGANGLYEYQTLGESEDYKNWVREYCAGEDGPDTYSWDEGIAP